MASLSIYRASAGSGKTHKLTEEYLKLIFQHSWNFRNILAVTFTNKATEEMKNRILNEIHKIARDKESDYYDILSKELKFDRGLLNKKAEVILTKILHNYSDFNISTIDSFFQRIIRSFIREIGLDTNYTIELDINKVLTAVSDRLLMDIQNNPQLLEWILNFAEEKIESGFNWDFKKDIQHLGYELFKEDFKSFNKDILKKLSNKDFLTTYKNKMYRISEDFKKEMNSFGKQAMTVIEKQTLTVEDFSYGKSGVAGYLNKITGTDFEPGTRAINAVNTPENWYSKTSQKKEGIISAYKAGLNDLLQQIILFYNKNKSIYYTAEAILRNFSTLGLLSDLSEKIRDYNDEHHVALLSDAGILLNSIIADTDAPFVYEKTGTYIHHFMIDEFQDTSRIQWDNFKPLILNSLANNNSNLIVGDVKQSIYRWRNSDWKVLAETVQSDLSSFDVEPITLERNWRSKKNIVLFNNSIFYACSNILQEHYNRILEDSGINSNSDPSLKTRIKKAYNDVIQRMPESEENKIEGHVNISFISAKEDIKWKEEVIQQIPSLIEKLQDHQYQLKDIAILTRNDAEGKEIADALMSYREQKNDKKSYRYDVISTNSVYLKNSVVIQFLIPVLKYFNQPQDHINNSLLLYLYLTSIKKIKTETINPHEIFSQEYHLFEKEISSVLNKSNVNLEELSLSELIENLILLFHIPALSTELPYLQSFLDLVSEYGRNQISDIGSFLEWWEERKDKETVSACNEQDAIRMMTIHKSKGLEFKNVIIPFCNWNLDHDPKHEEIIWCKTTQEPFNELELLPIRYTSLKNTIFYTNYLDEKLQTYMDNLNLLYVAFTRARCNMFIFSPAPKDETKGLNSTGNLIYQAINNPIQDGIPVNTIDLKEYWNKSNLSFTYGIVTAPEIKKKEGDKIITLNEFPTFLIKKKLKQKYENTDFFDFTESTENKRNHTGTLMHQLFANMITSDDVDHALSKMMFEGKISNGEKEEWQQKINVLFKNKQIASWFSKEWTVKTEADILLQGGKIKRPDRVLINGKKAIVIDFKFGLKENKSYDNQVKEYMKTLKHMGYNDISGFLWFVEQNRIEEITG